MLAAFRNNGKFTLRKLVQLVRFVRGISRVLIRKVLRLRFGISTENGCSAIGPSRKECGLHKCKIKLF